MRPRASDATTQVVFDRLTVRDAVAFADLEPFTERLLSDDALSVHDVNLGAVPKETVCAEIAVERRTIAVKIIVRFMACSSLSTARRPVAVGIDETIAIAVIGSGG